MLTIAICNSDYQFAKILEKTLYEMYPKYEFQIDLFRDGNHLSQTIFKKYYDLYILDIQMSGVDGISLAKKIRKKDNKAFIVYITSCSKSIKKVFKVNAFDYLIKPVCKEELQEMMERMLNSLKEMPFFKYQKGKVFYAIDMNTIIYFEKMGRYVVLHATNRKERFIMNTVNLLEQLTPSFIQVHRSYIVNVNYIIRLNHRTIYCKSAPSNQHDIIEIPFGRKYKRRLILNQTSQCINTVC